MKLNIAHSIYDSYLDSIGYPRKVKYHIVPIQNGHFLDHIGIIVDIILQRPIQKSWQMGELRKDINKITNLDKPLVNIKLTELSNDLISYLDANPNWGQWYINNTKRT